MFAPLWHTPVKIVLTLTFIVGGYAWVSVEDWEVEMEEEQAKIALAEAQKAIPDIPPELEVDPVVEYKEPEPPPTTPLVRAQNTVKKAAVKTKKRVKKALKPKQ